MTTTPHREDRQQRRPKLLQVVHHLDLGGSEEVAISLSEQLQEKYEIQFFAVRGVEDTEIGRNMKARLDRLGIPVHTGTRLELKSCGFMVGAARLAQVTQRERPDIVHLHTEIPELTHAISQGFLGKTSGRAAILTRTLHNTVYWGPWQRMGAQVERRLSASPLAACSAAALTGMQAFRASNGLSPLSSRDAQVIYNGVKAAPVTPSDERGSQREKQGPLKVLFAARLELQKGADLLPAILAHAGTLGHPAAELNIYGSGNLQPDLERWIAAGVPGWTVKLHPPTAQLRELMGQHDLLLMPSRFEGLALLAAEALMAGLPILSTRIPGLNELLTDPYPLLAPNEDTQALGTLLAQMLNDPERFRALAHEWIEPTTAQFGVARMAREYDEFYQRMLESRAPANQAQQLNSV